MADGVGTGREMMGLAGVFSFEPLPFIASERRIHVRAYHYWRARADGRAMPMLDDCADIDSAGFSDQMILVDLARGQKPAQIRTIGDRLATEMPTAERTDGGLVEELLARLPTVALQRSPIGFEAESPEGGEGGRCFRGILLPIADETGVIAHVLGVMSWRHVVTEMPGEDVMAAVASLASAPDVGEIPSPWTMPAPSRPPLPAASAAERIATARTWAALAVADRTRPHLHAAIGAAHDAVTSLSSGEGAALVHSLFGDGADLPLIERVLGQARLLAIGGQELAHRLDLLPDGMASFVAPAAIDETETKITRLRFRLTPLGPELLAPARHGAQDAGDFPARRAAR